MQAGAFIIFNPITDTENRRTPTQGVASSTREAELESAFIRSHSALVVHARRRHEPPAFDNLRPQSRKYVRPKRSDRQSRPRRQTFRPLLIRPSSPYKEGERELLQWYFQHTCLVRGNGDSLARTFWEVTAPQMAWHEQCIRHAFLAQALAMKVYTDKQWGGSNYYLSLKYQNSAVQELTMNLVDTPTLLIAALIFSVGSQYINEWGQAYQHSLSVLKLFNTLGPKVSDELESTFNYVRQLCEDVVDGCCAITGKVIPRSGQRLGQKMVGKDVATAASSPYPEGVTTAKWSFFDTLLALAVTQHNLHYIIKALESPIISPGYQHLLRTNLHIATLNFALSTLTKITWLYSRWTSDPYQRKYLTSNQRRELLHLGARLQSSDNLHHDDEFEAYLALLVSPIPLFSDINDVAFLLDVGRQSWFDDTGDHHTGAEKGHRAQLALPNDFPVLSTRHFSYIFLPIAAGRDPRLRQDVWEWTAVS